MIKYILILLFVVIIFRFIFGYRKNEIEKRDNSEKKWANAFPSDSYENIHTFLQLFVDEMMFPDILVEKMLPEDSVLDIFSVVYSKQALTPKSVELKGFLSNVSDLYGFDLCPIWHSKITLQEIYREISKNAKQDGE